MSPSVRKRADHEGVRTDGEVVIAVTLGPNGSETNNNHTDRGTTTRGEGAMSRSSTPELPPQDLWSSILDSVSQSRSIPAKQVLILGQPSSGKSTLASALLQKPPSDDPSETNLPDFALGYDWADVRDEGDEGKIALFRFLSTVALKQLFFDNRYTCTVVCVYCTVVRCDLYLSITRLLAATTIVTAYSRDYCP